MTRPKAIIEIDSFKTGNTGRQAATDFIDAVNYVLYHLCTMDSSVKQLWNNKVLGYVLLGLGALSAIFLSRWDHPLPGVAIAILGLAAAITAIREMNPMEKVAWVFVFSGLLYAEIRAISVDRKIQDVQHDLETKKMFDSFKAEQESLQQTLNTATMTLQQTQPHSYLQWTAEDVFLPDQEGHRISGQSRYIANRPYEVILNFVNRGAVDAQNVKAMSRVYLGANGLRIAPRDAVRDFLKRWNSWKVPMEPTPNTANAPKVDSGRVWRTIIPEEKEVQNFYRSFSSDEINALEHHKEAIYFLTRIEYSDATGSWRMDRCKRLATDLNAEGQVYNSCSIFDDTRIPVPNSNTN